MSNLIKGIALSVLAVLLQLGVARAQFSAKWDQFLPIVVTNAGNGAITDLYVWQDEVYAFIGGKTFKSSDGEIWTEMDGAIPPEKIVNGVAFRFNDTWSNRNVLSRDLVDWQPIVLIDGDKTPISDISFGNGWWVAVNEHGQIFRSPDLENWRSERTPTASLIHSIEFLSGKFIANGESEEGVFTSENGEFWSVEVFDDFQYPSFFNGRILDSFLGNVQGRFFYYSDDGSTWNYKRIQDDDYLREVRYADNTFVAIGTNASCYASSEPDGEWEKVPLPGTWDLKAITYFKGRWIIGGDNGALVIANPVEEPSVKAFDPQLRISNDGTLHWTPLQDTPLTIEDSPDLSSWSLLF